MAVCKSYKIREIPALKIHGRTADETGPLTIFWTGGIEQCVEDYQEQTGDRQVEMIEWPPLPAGSIGERKHPRLIAHQRMASILQSRFCAALQLSE